MFAKVIGENNMSKCCLVTTKLSLQSEAVSESRETELKTKRLLEASYGAWAGIARFADTMKSAIDIIRPLVGSQGFYRN